MEDNILNILITCLFVINGVLWSLQHRWNNLQQKTNKDIEKVIGGLVKCDDDQIKINKIVKERLDKKG